MNENEMTQEQQDAAEVQRMRVGLETFGAFAPEYYRAAIHTIDRQAAEIARLRAENERLRAACEGVPEILDEAAIQFSERMGSDTWPPVIEACGRAAAIRNALASDGAGTVAK